MGEQIKHSTDILTPDLPGSCRTINGMLVVYQMTELTSLRITINHEIVDVDTENSEEFMDRLEQRAIINNAVTEQKLLIETRELAKAFADFMDEL